MPSQLSEEKSNLKGSTVSLLLGFWGGRLHEHWSCHKATFCSHYLPSLGSFAIAVQNGPSVRSFPMIKWSPNEGEEHLHIASPFLTIAVSTVKTTEGENWEN